MNSGSRIGRLLGDQNKYDDNFTSNKAITINITKIIVDGTGNMNSKELSKMKTFVVLKPGEDGYIIAECPTLPGCITQGKTEEEAIKNAKELIELYLEVSREYNLDEPLKAYEVEV
ncbi:type II toxin-antitoxin system HicB family antitoxin [Thermoanaerobacterium thermosaccharolyticum]|uniref:type II toxin-antitoxin system HicB family antitoxin n=1 Tax=Thermoanaerobacterium thermosaccharolyticum TaxID=1517 RepID=UPI003DA7AD14